MPAAEYWYHRPVTIPPLMNKILIVDDNNFYADKLGAAVTLQGTSEIVRAYTAAEGIEILGNDCQGFDGIITDISMENQLSGMRVVGHANQCGYSGILSVATTGIDSWFGFNVNLLVFGYMNKYKTDYLIPKRAIKRDETILWLTPPGAGRNTHCASV